MWGFVCFILPRLPLLYFYSQQVSLISSLRCIKLKVSHFTHFQMFSFPSLVPVEEPCTHILPFLDFFSGTFLFVCLISGRLFLCHFKLLCKILSPPSGSVSNYTNTADMHAHNAVGPSTVFVHCHPDQTRNTCLHSVSDLKSLFLLKMNYCCQRASVTTKSKTQTANQHC